MKNTLIFDFDDTICNTTECIEQALEQCHKKFVKLLPNVSLQDLKRADKEAFKELFYYDRVPVYRASFLIWYRILKKLKIKENPILIYNMYKTLHKEVTKNIRLNSGIKRLLRYAKKHKMKIGILSNGNFIEKLERLIKLKIYNSNIRLLTSDITGYEKPDPRAFRRILRMLNSKPSNTIFIGDTLSTDILGAQRAGIMPVLYLRKNMNYSKAKLHKLKYIVKDHNDVINILESLQ